MHSFVPIHSTWLLLFCPTKQCFSYSQVPPPFTRILFMKLSSRRTFFFYNQKYTCLLSRIKTQSSSLLSAHAQHLLVVFSSLHVTVCCLHIFRKSAGKTPFSFAVWSAMLLDVTFGCLKEMRIYIRMLFLNYLTLTYEEPQGNCLAFCNVRIFTCLLPCYQRLHIQCDNTADWRI